MISRAGIILRTTKLFNNNSIAQSIRNSHQWNYRVNGPPASKNMETLANVVGGVAWWWVLWHIITEPGHILGEFEYPDARKWTNEELGIPNN